MDQGTHVNKIPLILLTGFLGSGKTSLLKHILREIGATKRIAIVQNEFVPGRVDSIDLQSTGVSFDLLEINNGSVFCACLLDNFVDQLSDFIQTYQPEAIFLEATGLADPVSLGQIMQSPAVTEHLYLSSVWAVVDTVNFSRSHQYIQRVRHQIQIADIILLNKTDLVAPSEELKKQLHSWNPFAKQFPAKLGKFSELNKVLLSILDPELAIDLKSPQESHQDALPRPDIGTCIIRTQKTFTEKALKDFHKHNIDAIYRMKGYARTSGGEMLVVQSVFKHIEIRNTEQWSGPTELIIMGPGIRPGPITKELLKAGTNEKKDSSTTSAK